MRKLECDVLVVGCGPAGASAARAAALSGAKTMLIEKKKTIGEPVACGEAIGACYLGRLPLRIPKSQLLLKLDGIRLIYKGNRVDKTGGVWPGYAISRAKFDRFLAHEAEKAGAMLATSAELVGLERKQNEISSLTVSRNGSELQVIPKAVVAADGVDSPIAKNLGLLDTQKGSTGEIYSWEMHGVKLDSLKFDQIFLGDFIDAGYGYIFPKSRNVANVGVGSIFPKRRGEEYFKMFLQHPAVRRQVSGAKMAVEKSKPVPFGRKLRHAAAGNVLFTGDAANQNIKPFVEGILPGVICGDVAGKQAAATALRGEPASSYERAIRKAMPELAFSEKLAGLMLSVFRLEPERQNAILYLLTAELVEPEQAASLLKKSAGELRSLMENR